ncbi:host cell division inhibitor Icd-like protein [Yersinia bercovieri]|uniref:host cell division inhibitor Icd-like protein n=1 Tax=Yersinia bercovieri TaxID=634 RepID=UPI0025AB05C3|nr:host cell division inhibitor Icd-like protein [Yersinia bercovieri]MDN0101538.1 host cell division inhibitor Icd-like protein [Yersinia bercovieri]
MASHHGTQTRPNFIWLFLVVRRSDVADKPRRHQITAPTYDAARRLVVRDYVAVFAGRLPTGGKFTMFKIITTTDEYMNGQRVSTESAPYLSSSITQKVQHD